MSFSFFCEKYVLRDCCLFKLILFDLISYRTLRRGRFQQYLQAPFAPIYFCAKKLQSQTATGEKLGKTLSSKKVSNKMLMKSTLASSSLFYLLW